MALDHTLAAGIEFDLRHYRRWRARVAELDTLLADVPEGRRDVLQISGVQHGPGDPTFRVVHDRERLWEERADLRRKVGRVENVLGALTTQQHRLVELRYFDDHDRGEVLLEMSISRTEFYTLRDRVLEIYAEVAGLSARATA